MKQIYKLLRFVKPYWRLALLSLALLTSLVFLDLAIPRLIQRIIDDGIKQNNMSIVLRTSALMFALSAVSALMAIGNNIYSIRVGEGVARDLREALFVKIQSFSYGNIDQFTTGRLMVRLSSDVAAVQRVFQVSLRIGTRAPLLMVGSLILMINTSPELALTMVPLLLVTSAVIVVYSVKMEPLFLSVQQKLDRLNTVLQENIAGARLVKAFVRAEHEGKRFAGANQDLTERNIDVMQFMSTMSPVLTIFVNIGMVVVIYAGGLRAISGNLSVGQIVAFSNYLLTTMTPLIMMTMLSNTWANGIASAGRVNEVLDTTPEVQDAPQAAPLPDIAQARVAFEGVSFRYNGDSDNLVLEDINLVAEPGEMVAILGATGAGKTSLVHLIPRFYDPCKGRILVDGVDIRDIEQDSLLAHVGIVPQETILFSGTVRDNIRYGRPDATDEEVIAAAQVAQAHDFIMRLPQGYDTYVEERGANLSGGQKQRVAIARALVNRPKILILDDSTSSVDVETETKIQDGLREIMQDCTSFVVAQRISTVLRADKIIVIDKGRVVAQGTHAQLMQTSPIYREIYDSQLGDGNGGTLLDLSAQSALRGAENV
ncbi:MAG: ABC transporter ATP-binding protein [Chloroflexi bacterium]|jgi:ATP-binding cassette subfamily B multidrug efflux pump|nr:ABC transporter ATP-binding protein [Chloroflexota bacterium]